MKSTGESKQVGRARGRADERTQGARERSAFSLKSAAACCDQMDLTFDLAAAASKPELPLAQIHRRKLAEPVEHEELFAVVCSSHKRQFDWPNSCRLENE